MGVTFRPTPPDLRGSNERDGCGWVTPAPESWHGSLSPFGRALGAASDVVRDDARFGFVQSTELLDDPNQLGQRHAQHVDVVYEIVRTHQLRT
jgi:hypothetical protein